MNSSELRSQRLPEIDAFKGILILLIVLGHNTLFSEYHRAAFSVLYNFHVASFLLLPFLFSGPSSREYRLKDRATRYLIPQFVFFFAACMLYAAFSGAVTSASILDWLGRVVLAIVISSEGAYGAACGFRMFWFLPMLLALTLLRAFFLKAGRKRRLILLVGTLGVHLFLGLVPEEWLSWFPWGTPLAMFLFPLGLLVGWLWNRFQETKWIFVCGGVVGVACLLAGYLLGSYSGLAGDPGVFSLLEPFQLAFHDVYLIAAFFGLLGLAAAFPCKPLAAIGKDSLVIFLAHGFFWQAFLRIGLVGWIQQSIPGLLWVQILVSFLVTVVLSFFLAASIQSVDLLRSIVTPRDWADWRGGLIKIAGLSRP